MIEVTLHIPGLADGLLAIAEAIRKAPTPVARVEIPEQLMDSSAVTPPEEPKPKRGRPAKVTPGDMPAAAPVSSGTKLADPEDLRSQLRELMSKAMDVDLKSGNKEHRSKLQSILTDVHADSAGKISGLPDDKLDEAVRLVREYIETLD